MLTQLSLFLHHTTEPLYLLITALLVSTILYMNKQKSQAILLAITSLTVAIIIKSLKAIIQAPRPTNSLIIETGYSFPSGHTTFAIVFFGLLVYIFTKPNKRLIPSILATFIITAIALSRLILKVHYPTDIIAGLIIGTTILTISILTHKKLTS